MGTLRLPSLCKEERIPLDIPPNRVVSIASTTAPVSPEKPCKALFSQMARRPGGGTRRLQSLDVQEWTAAQYFPVAKMSALSSRKEILEKFP